MDPVQCAICNRTLRNAAALNLHVESGCVQRATDDGVRKSPRVDRLRRKVKDKVVAAAVTQAGAPVPGPPGAAGSASRAGATASGAGAAVTQAGAPVPGPPGAAGSASGTAASASGAGAAGPPGAAAGN